jgi:hypothetical protein
LPRRGTSESQSVQWLDRGYTALAWPDAPPVVMAGRAG